MFVVKTGVVRAYSIVDSGNEVIIAMFGLGDYFPEATHEGELPTAMFYYDMLTDGELEVRSQADHKAAQASDPSSDVRAQRRYLGALLHINALTQPTAMGRLAHVLRYLALRFGVAVSGKSFTKIDLKLTQADLAQICNLSRETVNAELSKLKQQNIVTVRQKTYTVNVRALMKIIDDTIDVSLSDQR